MTQGARERRGLTGRFPAPRSQKRPDDQTGEVKPGRGSHDQPWVRTPRERQRINRFSDGFLPSTSHLWNSLPSAVFPASFNLPSFKRQVYHHLRDQMHDFFFITLFRYFTIVLFFTLHFFSFSQGMQTRERAHCARSVFPFIKKKKKKKSELKPWRELEDPTLMGTSKFPRGTAPLDPTVTPTDPKEKEKPTLRQRQRRSD